MAQRLNFLKRDERDRGGRERREETRRERRNETIRETRRDRRDKSRPNQKERSVYCLARHIMQKISEGGSETWGVGGRGGLMEGETGGEDAERRVQEGIYCNHYT